MKGIKSHNHHYRQNIIRILIPQLQDKWSDNFLALAADGSFARDQDTEYSDLELILFLKKLPDATETTRYIQDGQLVVIVPETKTSFIEKYKEVSDVWFASGAGKLLPIVNDELIQEINSYQPAHLEQKCLKQIEKRWPFFQEITAKVLNNLKQKDTEALALSYSSMIKELLVILAYMNTTPFITLGSYISQARHFPRKPEKTTELIDILVNGTYSIDTTLDKKVENVFGDLEDMLREKDVALYSTK